MPLTLLDNAPIPLYITTLIFLVDDVLVLVAAIFRFEVFTVVANVVFVRLCVVLVLLTVLLTLLAETS